MHTRIDVIDGQEVTIKVYATRPLPKKCTVGNTGSRRRAIKEWKQKKALEQQELRKAAQRCVAPCLLSSSPVEGNNQINECLPT